MQQYHPAAASAAALYVRGGIQIMRELRNQPHTTRLYIQRSSQEQRNGVYLYVFWARRAVQGISKTAKDEGISIDVTIVSLINPPPTK